MVEPTNDKRESMHTPLADEHEHLADDRVLPLQRVIGRKRPGATYGGGAVADGATVRELLPMSPDRTPRADNRTDEIATDLGEELSRLRTMIGDLELKVREQVELEHVRDLEIVRLERELEVTKTERTRLAEELFHATRRADDLDARWNALAVTYQECAEHLVEAGAQLESIHEQTSYRVVLAITAAMRRRPALYAMAKRLFGGRARPKAR
jgi:hypothetical protein